jgi:hypothetical protein
VFDTISNFYPSLLFSGKAWSGWAETAPLEKALQIFAGVELTDSDKQSTLLWYGNKVIQNYDIGLRLIMAGSA